MKKTNNKKIKPRKDQGKHDLLNKKKLANNNYNNLPGLGIIILLGIIIYSNSFNNSFHLDDSFHIIKNTTIRSLTDLKSIWNFNHSRFIAYITFAINYHFGKLNVWGYHLVNIGIHLFNACLVYLLTLLILSAPAFRDAPISRNKKLIALFTGLLFVSHPLATQSVDYIVQRMASLAAMFYFLSLVLYLKARISEKRNINTYLLFAGSIASALLGFLTKENVFTLPFAIVLFELFFFKSNKQPLYSKNYSILLLIGISILITIFILTRFTFSIFNPIPPTVGNDYTVTPFNYLFTQFSVIVKYIQLLILPINQNLDYDFPISNSFIDLRTMISFLVLLTIIGLSIYFFKKNRIISFGIIWFFLTLSIESSFLPLQDLIFEHRTYLPSYGFFLILTTVVYGFIWNNNKSLAITVLVVIIGINSILTYERNKVWKDDVTLWTDVVAKSPYKARPMGTLGDAYRDLGKYNAAIEKYNAAIQINSKYSTAYHDRAGVYGQIGQWDKAIADYSKAIDIDPSYKRAFYNRGNAFATLEKWDQAIQDYSKAIDIDAKFSFAYYARSTAYIQIKQWDKVISDCTKTIEIDDQYSLAYLNRGFAYFNLGQLDNAISDYTRCIEIDPLNDNAYFNRGVAYGNTNQWDKAVADYSKALEIDPQSQNAASNREKAIQKLESMHK
jgi:tetratricopeptide (TPR) repeat protein